MTSFVLSIAFVLVLLSGIALYISPRGRIAHWTGWSFLGLDREQWSALHLTTSLLLVVSSLSHLVFNWKVLVGYLKSRSKARPSRLPELVISVILCLIFVLGTIWMAPPIAGIVSLRDRFRQAEPEQITLPPQWHAEGASVEQFARMVGLETEQVAEALQAEGVAVASPEQTLEALAEKNDTTPQALYEAVLKHHPEAARRPGQGRGRRPGPTRPDRSD
jgi:hypothetical protein